MQISVAKVRDNLADALNKVANRGERIILMRRDKQVAALVPMEDLALLEEMEDKADLAAALKAKAEGGKPVPLEKVLARLGMKPKSNSRRSKVRA